MTVQARALAGQVALVTGASSGLGRATALGLAHAGADLILVARTAQDLVSAATEIEARGRRALPVAADLALEDDIAAAVEQGSAAFGRIDVLVNCAATDTPGPVVDLAVEAWDRVLDVNLRAPFLLAKAAFPHMRRAGRGTIVNISSVAGKRGWANAAAYCASKFGLAGLTQALAAEGRPYGIRACIIYPGGMATSWGKWSSEDRASAAARPAPPSEAMPAEAVADLIVWIASAPRDLVLNEAIITPLGERGWP